MTKKKCLILSQIHLINQTIEENKKWYGESEIVNINKYHSGDIFEFLISDDKIGIVNVDKFRNKTFPFQAYVDLVILDESSCLKNEFGKIRSNIIDSCRGVSFKIACTATPAPNDRQEYANHALFLDYIDNYAHFFHKFFYNTTQVGEKWKLRPHAKGAFYKFLSSWSIFLKNPANYGFDDNLCDLIKPKYEWINIPLTQQQRVRIDDVINPGTLFFTEDHIGGISNRNKLSQIAKGFIYE